MFNCLLVDISYCGSSSTTEKGESRTRLACHKVPDVQDHDEADDTQHDGSLHTRCVKKYEVPDSMKAV